VDPEEVARRQADSDEEAVPHTEGSEETELGLLREQNRRLLDELARQRKDQDDLTTKIEQLIDARSVKEPKARKTQRDPFSGLQDLADQYDSDDSDNEPDGRYRNQRFAERDIYTLMRELRSESGREDLEQDDEGKLNEVKDFTGDDKDYSVNHFLAKCRVCFNQKPSQFRTGKGQVGFAVMRLAGDAFEHVFPYISLPFNEQPAFLHDFEMFAQFMRSSFGKNNSKGDAVRAIKKLKQTGTASEFFSKFGLHKPLTGWNDEACIDAVMDRLRPSVSKYLEKNGYPKRNYIRFKAKAIEVDNRLQSVRDRGQSSDSESEEDRGRLKKNRGSRKRSDQRTKGESDHGSRERRQPSPGPRVTSATGSPAFVPRGGAPYRPITEAEKDQRRADGKCLRCGKPGHYARDCPDKPSYKPMAPEVVRIAREAPANTNWKKGSFQRSNWIRFEIRGQDPLVSLSVWPRAGSDEFVLSALLDTGASSSFIRPGCSLLGQIAQSKYEVPKIIRLVDNGPNPAGRGLITSYVDVEVFINGNIGPFKIRFDIMESASPEVILGLNFIKEYGVQMDWETCELSILCPKSPAKGENDTIPGETKWFRGQGEGSLDMLEAIRELELEEEEPNPDDEELDAMIPAEYAEFRDIFKKSNYEKLPPHRIYDHPVDLLPNVQLKRAKPYPMSADADAWLKAWIDKSREIGHIEPSSHWFGSPVFLVKKKGGDFRMVTDYCELNRATVKNAYPLPKIDTCLERVRTGKIFSKFDMPTSYQLLQMRPGDEKWTTILT
jgi:hypothetical protein